MCKLINVIEEPFYVYVDKCYTRNLFMCTLINVIVYGMVFLSVR